MDAFTLLTYSLQILLVIAAAACGAILVRPREPRFRLIYWRLVLLLCLLLPFVPARVIDVDLAAGTEVNASLIETSPPRAPARGRSPMAVVMWLVAGGAVARSLWLAVGLARLRALKAGGATVTLPEDLRILHRTLAPTADIRWHDRVPQPVTFGLRRPVILLPSRLGDLPGDLQRAVLCHELLHASRGDWSATLGEEAVRTMFWFHPAVRLAIAQIQLCREETVDALAVSITASRRPYMQALLAFAESPVPPLLPAPLFAHRRHLAVRIRQLSQEVKMSRIRIVSSAAALLAIVGASGWTVASALPLRTELRVAPGERHTARDVTLPASRAGVDRAMQRITPAPQPAARPAPPPPPPPPPPPSDGKKNPRVVSEVKPAYPSEALPHGVAASVWVAVAIDGSGQVSEAKATRFQLTIDRSIDDPNYWASKPERPFMEAAEAAASRWKFAPPDADTRTNVEVMFTFRIIPGAEKIAEPSGQPGVPNAAPALGWKPGPRVLRVGGGIQAPKKIYDVKPIYPETAQAQNVQGIVILELRIGVDGSIADARILRSIPLLDDAALAAARQWKFSPVLLNGEPVEVLMVTTINFVL